MSVWTERRDEDIRRAADEGLTRHEAAARFKISANAISMYSTRLGVKFRRKDGGRRPPCPSPQRTAEMEALYREGITLQEIADLHGITRERVRQILSKETSVTRHEGGGMLKDRRAREKAKARRLARHHSQYGCSPEQLAEARHLTSATGSANPTYAFSRQKSNLARDGVVCDLTFWEWWTIWQESGKWAERGQGRYGMRRHDPDRPFALGNVYVCIPTVGHRPRKLQRPVVSIADAAHVASAA